MVQPTKTDIILLNHSIRDLMKLDDSYRHIIKLIGTDLCGINGIPSINAEFINARYKICMLKDLVTYDDTFSFSNLGLTIQECINTSYDTVYKKAVLANLEFCKPNLEIYHFYLHKQYDKYLSFVSRFLIINLDVTIPE